MRGSRASAASGVSWAIVLLTLSVSGSAPAQDGYPQVPALSRSSPTALVAPAPEASPCACPVTARQVGYQAVTGQAQESSQFVAAPYNADAAVDGDDFWRCGDRCDGDVTKAEGVAVGCRFGDYDETPWTHCRQSVRHFSPPNPNPRVYHFALAGVAHAYSRQLGGRR